MLAQSVIVDHVSLSLITHMIVAAVSYDGGCCSVKKYMAKQIIELQCWVTLVESALVIDTFKWVSASPGLAPSPFPCGASRRMWWSFGILV